MLDESLLDGGGRGVAQALGAAALIVVALLGLAILVPVVVLVSLVPGASHADAGVAQSPSPTPGSATVADTAQPQPRSTTGGSASAGSAAVEVARRYLGVRYLFGGTDPAVGLDCSGLVQLVFRQLGISLPRTAQQQYNATSHVQRADLQPGDLVFFARTYADPNDFVTHVGIYIGDGMQINAPTEGQVVSIQPVFTGFWGAHFFSGGRPGNGRN
jgi:cell wall-associated NlpC family hydrolase